MSVSNIAEESNRADIDSYVFFWKVADPYGEFSQWLDSPFVLDEKSFKNAEQYMMYSKADLFGDREIAKTILFGINKSPAWYKKMGRKVSNFNQDIWDKKCMDAVIIGNLCKFTQDDKLMNILINTKEKMIVEASPLDKIWGIGFNSSDALMNKKLWGHNKLGKALMVVRSIIIHRKANGDLCPFTNTAMLTDMCRGVHIDEFDIESTFINQ